MAPRVARHGDTQRCLWSAAAGVGGAWIGLGWIEAAGEGQAQDLDLGDQSSVTSVRSEAPMRIHHMLWTWKNAYLQGLISGSEHWDYAVEAWD